MKPHLFKIFVALLALALGLVVAFGVYRLVHPPLESFEDVDLTTVPKISYCDLRIDPKAFSGKIVRLKNVDVHWFMHGRYFEDPACAGDADPHLDDNTRTSVEFYPPNSENISADLGSDHVMRDGEIHGVTVIGRFTYERPSGFSDVIYDQTKYHFEIYSVEGSSTTPDRSVETVIPDIPKTTWEPIYFRSIDRATSSTGFDRLRENKLADADIEVRMWAGFGLTQLKGFVLKREGSAWTAYRIGSNGRPYSPELEKFVIPEPANGWESAWNSLLQQHILSLPDARSINCEGRYMDGYSYVVEVKKGSNYRTYMYANPWAEFDNRCKEADEILNIASIVTDDYGIADFRADF